MVLWNMLALIVIMKQILYLVSINQVQWQSRWVELQCASWLQGDRRLLSSKFHDKGFTFLQILFRGGRDLYGSSNLDWAVRYINILLHQILEIDMENIML